MVANWILVENVDPFLTTLSWLVGYSIDDDDWQAINNDLLDGGGVDCGFTGNQTIKVNVLIDRQTNTSKATVTVESPEDLEPQVDLVIAIFQNFQLRKSRK